MSINNYLIFHIIIEFFAILVAFGIFLIGWHSRNISDNHYLAFLGIAYLFVGSLDFIHTIAYKGMRLTSFSCPNYATSLWIAARYTESISILLAQFFISRKIRNFTGIFFIYLGITFFITLSILYFRIFPQTFINGTGLTPFKIASEYIISAIFLTSIFILRKKRHLIDRRLYFWLFYSIVFSILSELSFTLYNDPYAIINSIGHVFKLYSFYLIYKSVILSGLERPYSTIFRNLLKREKELKEKNDELRSLTKLKDDFLTIASHDMRVPFSGILGFANMLLMENEMPNKFKEDIGRIRDSAVMQLEYVDSLLDAALYEAGQAKFNLKKTDLSKLTLKSIELLKFKAGENKVELSFDIAENMFVEADTPKIIQVINNLISNAIKYTSPGGSVNIKLCKDEDKKIVCFKVKDTGVGIDGKSLKVIFKRFKRINPDTEPSAVRDHSLGLGLWISKLIVESHAGEIGVTSQKGLGSTFFFTLPYKP
jgi:signal transduction histidine kinase